MDGENEKYLATYPWALEFDRFLPSPGMFKHKATSSTSAEPNANPGPAAIKRLTSPEGTVSVSNLSAGTKASTATSTANYQHNGYQSQSTRDHHRSYAASHSSSSHHHHHPSTHHVYSSSSSSHAQSGNHSYSYYDSSTRTGSEADTTSSYRTSPSSTFSSHSRPQHHERKLSSSANSQAGYANGYGDHVS